MVLLVEGKSYNVPDICVLRLSLESLFSQRSDGVHTTDGGLNFRTPGPPTITSIVAERASWADASRKTEPRAKWRIATEMQNYGRSEGKIKKRPGVTEGPTFNVATPTEKKRRKERWEEKSDQQRFYMSETEKTMGFRIWTSSNGTE
jgi:hypothetical protein